MNPLTLDRFCDLLRKNTGKVDGYSLDDLAYSFSSFWSKSTLQRAARKGHLIPLAPFGPKKKIYTAEAAHKFYSIYTKA